MKNLICFIFIICYNSIDAQIANSLYFNYDELIAIELSDESNAKIHYTLNKQPKSQTTDYIKTDTGIKLGKLTYNSNQNVKKLSSEPLEFIGGNLYLPKYKMYFYSDTNRKIMENQDCYIVNNEIFYSKKGKIKGKLKSSLKKLRKETLQTIELDSKDTFDKFGIHCLGATEIFGIPTK